MRIIKISTIVILVLLVLGVIAFQVFFHLPLPGYSGTANLQGLKSPVEVRFDTFGVPHIFAENTADLFFAQGYVTARERMFEMDMTRLAGRGELSTLFGDRTIKDDKFLKTVGFYRAAKKEYAAMPQELKDVILAYTNGVNAYLKTVRHLPREYIFLGAKPAPWLPEDTVVIGILMGYTLEASIFADLPLYRISERVGEEKLRFILPSFPDFAPTISPQKTALQGNETKNTRYASFSSSSHPGAPSFSPSFLPGIIGSNWMIFGPSRTTTGRAIFTGSPDLEPKIPSIFYLVHLKGAGYDVIGGSTPGTPGISVLGFNGNIAWSSIANQIDCLDYFIEKLNPANPNQYLTENGNRVFETVVETLKIKTKSGIREEKLKVRISRHGPIISDVEPKAPDNCAMMWVGSEGSHAFEAFLKLDRARNFAEFRSALSGMTLPELNLGYADRDGNIGYQNVAKPPLREKGNGALPIPGWEGEYDWVGYRPFDDLPYDLNPSTGYLGGFNNESKKTSYHLSNFYFFERALRFREIMQDRKTPVSPTEARKLQLDTVSVVAKRLVPHFVRVSQRDGKLSRYTPLFNSWDYSLSKDSNSAALYSSVYYHLITNTFSDEIPEGVWADLTASDLMEYVDAALAKIIDTNDNPWFDDVNTKDRVETRDEIIKKSLGDAVDELTNRLGADPKKWHWGKLHTMTFAHPLGEVLWFLNLKPIPMGGDPFTIGAANWDQKKRYNMIYGGCIRMIVDFADIDKSTFISPPGQSGHYMSPHYDDLPHRWADNDQIPLNYQSAQQLRDVLILQPLQ